MQTIGHTIRLGAATVLVMVLGSYVHSASAEGHSARNIHKINSGIQIETAEQVGDVRSVNGRISIGEGASAYELNTVNGRINVDDNAEIENASTVNGRITIGSGVSIRDSVSTVNGRITTGAGTSIERRIRTVNGSIDLTNTQIGGNVQTANGDIELRDGTVVEGDIVVKGRQSWLDRFVFFNNSKPSDLVIDASSVVKGDIHLHREVDLRIDDDAQIGEIIEHF